MFLRGQDWSWYYFPSWPGRWDAMCSRQICRWPQIREGELSRCFSACQDAEFGWSEPHPGTGGCQKMHKVLYSVQSNLSRGTWKWLFPSALGALCPVLGSSQYREMLTNKNEFAWFGAGAHNTRGKTKSGRGGSGLLISSIPAWRELTEKTGPDVFWRCIAKGQEAMVTNCSEGDPVQRQGKNIHSRRNCGLSIHPLMTCWRQLWVIQTNLVVSLHVRRTWD